MAVRTIPSLVIGLGGTGKRALTHLKRRIYDTYRRSDLPWIRLLSIDTDDATVNNPPVISQLTGEHMQLGNTEQRIIDQSDTPKVISNLDAPENRHIKQWYPDPDGSVDFPKAARGSGQVRMFGRIGLYKGENLHTVYRWLQQAGQEVSDPAAWDEFSGFAIEPSLQFVYVVCSLCGGTGSGMFLDVAYMLRKIVGVEPSTRRFIGMFVLPEVYEPVVENQHIKRIYANTYAALRELDYLMNSPRRSYTISGKDHTFVDFERDVPPFDFVFLLSNKNKRGAVISQRQVSGDKPVATDDRVSQYISESIMTDVLSPVTERSESILSNIFTSIGEPESMEERTFHKTFSSVGVSSVKIPPLEHFRDLVEARAIGSVIDFLLRPDPEITEKALAKEFFADHLATIEDRLLSHSSLSSDDQYGRFLSRPFLEEFRNNRPACINAIRDWVERTLGDTIDLSRPLEAEKSGVESYRETLDQIASTLGSTLRTFANDPERGYSFIKEWVEELLKLCNAKAKQVPGPRSVEGDPKRSVKEALESIQRVAEDIQLPVLSDTVEILLERLSSHYDTIGRSDRGHNLIRMFYDDLSRSIQSNLEQLSGLVDTVAEIDSQADQHYSSRIAAMGDTAQERVLIDKSMIGRKELEKFLNYLLGPIWDNRDWRAPAPSLSKKSKDRVTTELSGRLLEIQFDDTACDRSKKEKLESEVRNFVAERIFNELYPTDQNTGRLTEPTYADADGRSILFDFAPDNLLPLMLAHSSPLWFVQTHQVGPATSPITFVGANGTKIPSGLVGELQKHISTFRTTDIVLSDAEPRVVVKQYDPLYSLASLGSMIDYENYYQNTDRKMNPMHTDIRFASEPNPFLQHLSYRTPAPPPLKICDRGHDITRALNENRQYCPHCSRDGVKSFIVPGKTLCPKCNKVIDKGNRKCPECSALLEARKEKCPGCITQGREQPEMMIVCETAEADAVSSCPACGSMWTNLCPYCSTPLENPTMCTKGSDRCIFESPPIALCSTCGCAVTPDTIRCPRCLGDLKECQTCRERKEPARMIPATTGACSRCNTIGVSKPAMTAAD